MDDLRNSISTITKSILYMYSMETFLPYTLNKAEREKDASKVKSLGPFGWVLGNISMLAYSKRKDKLTSETFVYRGVKLPLKIFEEYKDIQNKKERL